MPLARLRRAALAAALLLLPAAAASAQASELEKMLKKSMGVGDSDVAKLMKEMGVHERKSVALTGDVLDRFVKGAAAANAEHKREPLLERYQDCKQKLYEKDSTVAELDGQIAEAERTGDKAAAAKARARIAPLNAKACGAEPANWVEGGPFAVYSAVGARASGLDQETYDMVHERVLAYLIIQKKGRYAQYTFTPAELAALKSREAKLRAAMSESLKDAS